MKYLIVAVGALLFSTTLACAQSLTLSQRIAVKYAEQYLSMQGFSRSALLQQLSVASEGEYNDADAAVAVDSLHINWLQQAVRHAKQELSTQSYSQAGLIQFLISPPDEAHDGDSGGGFSVADATAAVDSLHINSMQQAIMSAKEQFNSDQQVVQGVSRGTLMQQLTSVPNEENGYSDDGFSAADATAAINSLHVDWNAQAVMTAKADFMPHTSCQELINQLASEGPGGGFTKSQAIYGARQAGLCP